MEALIEKVEESMSEFFGYPSSVEWISKPEEINGFSVAGHYRLTVNGKGMDVYSDNALKALIPPHSKMTSELLESIKRSLKPKGKWKRIWRRK